MTSTTNIAAPADRAQAREQKLIRRMLQGEERAFLEFVNQYKDRLFAAMLAHVGSRHDAEEIVQETFVKAIQHLPNFRHHSQLYTWIYRIAWNTSASRKRHRRDEISLDMSGAESQSPAPAWSEPHVPMERRERVDLLRRGLNRIEGKHRRILVLREFDEMSYQQISEIMNIPLGTVRSRISRARQRLREELLQIEEESDTGEARDEAPSGKRALALAAR